MSSKRKAKDDATSLEDSVREAAGEAAVAHLGSLPLGIAAGGPDGLLAKACAECAGFPDPVAASVNRMYQLAGTRKPTDEASE